MMQTNRAAIAGSGDNSSTVILISTKKYAKWSGKSDRTIRLLCQMGDLPAFKIGAWHIPVSVKEGDKWP
jgi:hypothetical protein